MHLTKETTDVKLSQHSALSTQHSCSKYTFLKFLIVGVVNTIVGSGLMFFLYNVFSLSYWLSSVANYIAGGIVSYFLNKYFTFKNSQKSINQIILFGFTVAFCYLIAYGGAQKVIEKLLFSFDEKVRGNISLLCGMGLYTVLNYVCQKFLVFRVANKTKSEGE